MMHPVRPIDPAEYGAAKAVWDICFPEDAEGYSDYYFAHRTKSEYILAAYAPGGEMIGTLHALPYLLSFGGKVKNCALVTGVATLPHYRMRGVAASLLRASVPWLREKGVAAAVLKPDADIYGPFGYRPFSRHDVYCAEASSFKHIKAEEPFVPDAAHMLSCYERFSENYNGMLVRTEAYMKNIALEAEVSGAKVLASQNAYGIIYEGEREISVSELAGSEFLPFLAALSKQEKPIRFRLPAGHVLPGIAPKEDMVFSMLCPVDAASLLAQTGIEDLETLLSGVKKQNCTLEFC